MADSIDFTFDTKDYASRIMTYARRLNRDLEQVQEGFAANVLRDTKVGWPVDTGASKAAWQGPTRLFPFAYEIRNPAPYARVIEFGGYPGVGPKTLQVSGTRLPYGIETESGIVPKQRPAWPVRRALSRNFGLYIRRIRHAERREWGR